MRMVNFSTNAPLRTGPSGKDRTAPAEPWVLHRWVNFLFLFLFFFFFFVLHRDWSLMRGEKSREELSPNQMHWWTGERNLLHY